jgi:hypothetical protein
MNGLRLLQKTAFFVCVLICAHVQAKPMNVIFIGLDDLRPQLNSYGYPQMKTPNFDRMVDMGE